MSDALDLAHLRGWIGMEERAQDVLTPMLARRFRDVLDLPDTPATSGESAPRLIHFCLAHMSVPGRELGDDGHPERGGFLPPVPLPRRMWAGSDIAFHGDLCVGETVERRSRIADVAIKHGRTGPLCFVTVEHRFLVDGALRVEDLQTIVYRDAKGPAGTLPTAPQPAPAGTTTQVVVVSPPLLFRYSALTFNAHRIHYDLPYAAGVEGYPGLVVHGPLQATLLLHLATRVRQGLPPDRFIFRSQTPLYHYHPLHLHAGGDDGRMTPLWTAAPGGPVAMQAEARWN